MHIKKRDLQLIHNPQGNKFLDRSLSLMVMLVRLIPLWLIIYSHMEFCSRVNWSVEFPRTSHRASPSAQLLPYILKFPSEILRVWCSQGSPSNISSDLFSIDSLIQLHVAHFKVNAQRLSILMNISSDVCLRRNARPNASQPRKCGCVRKTMLLQTHIGPELCAVIPERNLNQRGIKS